MPLVVPMQDNHVVKAVFNGIVERDLMGPAQTIVLVLAEKLDRNRHGILLQILDDCLLPVIRAPDIDDNDLAEPVLDVPVQLVQAPA